MGKKITKVKRSRNPVNEVRKVDAFQAVNFVIDQLFRQDPGYAGLAKTILDTLPDEVLTLEQDEAIRKEYGLEDD